MAAIGQVIGVGGIKYVAGQAIVHRPVELQTLLATVQHTVGVGCQFCFCQGVVEDAHLGDVAVEGLFLGDACATAYRECTGYSASSVNRGAVSSKSVYGRGYKKLFVLFSPCGIGQVAVEGVEQVVI